MENLNIEATKNSPKISFNKSGALKIEGRAIPENSNKIFYPLHLWIEELTAGNIVFDINLEYMNTSASMQLFSLIKFFDQDCGFDTVVVNWHYEEDDEDHLEVGETYEENLLRTKFNYYKVEVV